MVCASRRTFLKNVGKGTLAAGVAMGIPEMAWPHSGFHVHIGERIWPDDEKGLENLARHIIRA